MKIFKLMVIALVAMVGLNSCSKDCDHEFIEVDYSNDIVGTWTCQEANYAAAFVFKADGTAFTTGVENGEYWENVQVNWKVVNNKLTLNYGDNTSETLLEIISGEYLSISDKNGDRRKTYKYCANDLADDIVGMWVSHDGATDEENDAAIMVFSENGKLTFTGFSPMESDFTVKSEDDYKVVGDLMFITTKIDGVAMKNASRIVVTPNASAYGDIMVNYVYRMGESVPTPTSFLRVKESLNLAGKKYDYIKTFVTNVDGLDQDIDFMGYTFNFAKMDGTTIDQMLKALLFSVEFPSANKIKYSCRFSSGVQTVEAPIAVDGNKMTLKMSQLYPTAKDVDLYTFQDADCSQMHKYMPTYAFVNFFGNMQVIMMSQLGQLDTNNAEAVKAVFDSIDDAVNTINVSFVMSQSK